MADVSLNGLKVKTDSLPNDWYVSLINPKDGEPAEIMTVAKFVELFTSKQPEVTESSKGLMSPQILKSNPGNANVNRKILNTSGLIGRNAFRIRKKANEINFNIKVLGGWSYGNAFGVLEKVICYFENVSASGTKVYKCSHHICNLCYISDPYKEGDYICIDIINKFSSGTNGFAVILESYSSFDNFEFINNQTPRSEDLTKNNRDETEFALKTSANTLAASPNALTDTIQTSPVLESRQVRSTCLQNHLYQIILPTCQDRKGQMVQHQLKVNQPRCRSSTFGLSIKLERQYLNCKKKINVSNKSSRLTA